MIFKNIKLALSVLTKKNKTQFKLFIFLTTLTMFFEFISIISIVPVLNILLDTKDNILNFDVKKFFFLFEIDNNTQILLLLAITFLFFLIKNIYLSLYYFFEGKFIYNVKREIASRLFDNYLRSTYSFFFEKNTSVLLSRVTNQAPLCGFCIGHILNLIANILVLAAICVLLFLIRPKETLVVAFITILSLFVYYSFTRKLIFRNSLWQKKADEEKINIVQETFGAIKEVFVYNVKNKFFNLYNEKNILSAKIGYKLSFINRFSKIFFELLIIFIIFTVIIYILKNNYEKKEILLVVGVFLVSFLRIIPAANSVLSSLQAIRMALPSVQSVADDLKNKNNLNINKKEFKFKSKIKFKNVFYKYPKSNFKILDNVNLVINKNDFVCIQGESGSGKTTFVDLLMGLLNPTSGKILCDKNNIKNLSFSWMKKISYVPQNLYLLNDTIRSNIIFTQEELSNTLNLRDTKYQHVTNFLNKKLLSKLDKNVGQNGSNMSGGERQRIGLARAMFKNHEILILDESTNALDKKNEELVFQALLKFRKNKTIIFITHKPIKYKKFDKIFRIENNKIRAVKNS